MNTKNIIISLVGLAIIVGAVLFAFRYEYVVVNQVDRDQMIVTYIVKINRFTLDKCWVVADQMMEKAAEEIDPMGNGYPFFQLDHVNGTSKNYW